MLFLAISCEQEKLQSENSIENLITGKDAILLQELAERQTILWNEASLLSSTMPESDYDKFINEISSITNDKEFDSLLRKYSLGDHSSFKSAISEYQRSVSKINEKYNIQSLNETEKQKLVKNYIAHFSNILKIPVETDETSTVSFRADCMSDCYYTGLENSLLCATGCIAGPLGCWIAVGCVLVRGRQLDRCYAGCKRK